MGLKMALRKYIVTQHTFIINILPQEKKNGREGMFNVLREEKATWVKCSSINLSIDLQSGARVGAMLCLSVLPCLRVSHARNPSQPG